MEDYMGIVLKRKELEDVNGNYSHDFSLSSPACKIRRLDAELPPIIKEEADFWLGCGQSVSESTISNGVGGHLKPLVIKELSSVPKNEEKDILFKSMDRPLFYASGNFFVDPKLISCLKNQAIWGTFSNTGRPSKEDEAMRNENTIEENACMAVIPWVPSQLHNLKPKVFASQMEVLEAMDAEETDLATMEIEDAGTSNVGKQASEYNNLSRLGEGLQHQLQQQLCMIRQPQNSTTQIVSYR